MSQWTIGDSLVDCLSLHLGLAQTDTAEVEFRAGESTGITDGEWVTLYCDGSPMLYGRATIRRGVSGRRDAVRMSIRGPWELLESTTYQQTTKVAVPHAVDSSHPYGYALADVLTPQALLGMADDGTARSTRQEAVAVMAYAAAAGVPLTFSPSFTGLAMRPLPMEGSSCAACLLALMRFHPDVLLWFDYSSGSGAALMAAPAGGLGVLSLSGGSAGSHRVEEASFERVPNYAPAGIRILYLRTGAMGRREAHTDTAGTIGGAGAAPNVINWVVELEGAEPPPLQTQRIRTRPIPHTVESGYPDSYDAELKVAWWAARIPWMRLPGVSEIVTVLEHTVTVDPPNITASEDDTDGIEDSWSLDPNDYPRELIDGTIAPWMTQEAAPLTITATLKLGDLSGLSDSVKEKLAKVFQGGLEVNRQAQVTGTDASTREYAALSSGAAPPDWPAGGIAAAYMAAFSAQAWQGSVSLTAKVQPRVALGQKLNLSGYEAAWASMAAVIRSVSYSPSSHSVSVNCGPPDNFGFGDFYELQRIMRKTAGVDARTAAERRTLGMPNSGGKIRGAGFTANRAVSPDNGGADSAGVVPWECRKAGPMTLRVWPAAVWDGAGNHIWPEIGGETSEPEHFYDAEIVPSSGSGMLYLDITVDDSDDNNGIVTAAELKLDYADHSAAFFTRSGSSVLIPICEVVAGSTSFTIQPLRTFVFQLRRYGPPGASGSNTWDVTSM